MRRYWISKDQIETQDVVHFRDDLFHHIFDVCRQIKGQQFEVITEDSIAYLVEVLDVNKKNASAKIIGERKIDPLPRPLIHLVLNIPRFPVLDAVCEKAVELGVSDMSLVFSEFSFVRSPKDFPIGKQQRLEKIVVSASQQCGRGDLMKIHVPVALDTVLIDVAKKISQAQPLDQTLDFDQGHQIGLFAFEGETPITLKNEILRLKQLQKQTGPSESLQLFEKIWLFVGSEGGYSKTEVKQLTDLGLHPVTLGRQILRVETACMALVSILKYDFGLME